MAMLKKNQRDMDSLSPTPYEEMSEDDGQENGKPDVATNPTLPGCSRGKDHGKKWNMSTSMMQAYIAMRGPGTDLEDPLLKWIMTQDKKSLENGVSGLTDEIHDSIYERADWKVNGPAEFDEGDNRRSKFQYLRPKIEHLAPPESLSSVALQKLCQAQESEGDGWNQYAASDVSDDEGDPTGGRVSPCTFARWAEGAQRWDGTDDKYRSKWEIRATVEVSSNRLRPPSPNTIKPRKPKYRNRKALIDTNDGKPLSPACSEFAETEPSVLWSPPPMYAALPIDYWNHKLDRMDPELAKALREGVASTQPSFGTDSGGKPLEHYSRSQVDQVVEKYWGAQKTHTLVAERHRDLAYLRFNEEQVNASNERYRHEIRRLKHENRKLGDCMVLRQERRDRRIMKSVYQHIRGLDYEAKAKLAEVKARWKENGELCDEYEGMKGTQGKLLDAFGKDYPKEVFEMFPDVWESLDARKNRRNFS